MLSAASAATLLAAPPSPAALAALAAAVGFRRPPLALDAATREALGVPPSVGDARLAAGHGTLRALLLECPADAPLRDTLPPLAARLAARAPHLLWLIVAARREGRGPPGGDVALATFAADRSRPRVAALLVDRARVVASDAETLCALAAASSAADDDVLVHARWLDVLGREALTRRFYRALERLVGTLAEDARGSAAAADRHEVALLYASRLLFLSFLETKGWLDGDHRFLAGAYERCVAGGIDRNGGYHRRVLLPLFFGTLNTPPRARAAVARAFGRVPFLNGGLFARTAVERRCGELRFTDDALGRLFAELLSRYRFTPREEGSAWSEAAIDPEMLGKAFESLMSAGERRASGAFYTPQPLVAAVTRAALESALAHPAAPPRVVERALAGGPVDDGAARALRARLTDLRVLDPACGSGAFLVHALETLGALAAHLGDARPPAAIRRELLTRAIFGVDVNPTAVWLCELRLWLSVVIESPEADPLAVPPLPNLDRHIRVGDALAGNAFGATLAGGGRRLAALRERYARASGARKRTAERVLERAERALAIAHADGELARSVARRRELLAVFRGRDLFGERVRATPADRARLAAERARGRELRARHRALRDGAALPFTFITHFPDVAQRGGFDILLGNPPWVRLHRIPRRARAALRDRYAVFREAGWTRGAALARAGAGFAAQVDLAALFTERSVDLLRPDGTLALLLPMKLWRSLAGGGTRRLLHDRATLVALEDWSESAPAFDAAVYPSLVVARRRADDAPVPAIHAALHRRDGALRWCLDAGALSLEDDPASPWLVLPPPVRAAFDRLARAGPPLASSGLGTPQLGVKCGCNEAFVVRWCGGEGKLAAVVSGRHRGTIERELLRPLLRGEHVAPWRPASDSELIIYTHDDGGLPLAPLPPHATRWLARWRRRLTARADARGGAPWWALFRTASADCSRARVVWADVGRAPRALVLPADDPTVALNSCYVLPCDDPEDAGALAALLNSPLAAAWLDALAEPARGGYRRYLAWTVALLPLPRDWVRVRAPLAALARRAASGDEPGEEALLAAALRAYGVRAAEVAPLLGWRGR